MAIVGIFAVIASLSFVVLALPAQIIRNFRRKKCEGLAPLLIYISCTSYTLWSIYAWLKPDWFLVASQIPGGILAFILLFQLFYYGRKTSGKK